MASKIRIVPPHHATAYTIADDDAQDWHPIFDALECCGCGTLVLTAMPWRDPQACPSAAKGRLASLMKHEEESLEDRFRWPKYSDL